MKKTALLACSLLAIAALSLSSCKKTDDEGVNFVGKWLVYQTDNPAAYSYYTFTANGNVEFDDGRGRKFEGTYSYKGDILTVNMPEIAFREGKTAKVVQSGMFSTVKGDNNHLSWDMKYYINDQEMFAKPANLTMQKDGVGKDDKDFNRLLGDWDATFEEAQVDAAAVYFLSFGYCVLSDQSSALIFSTFNIRNGLLTINVSNTQLGGEQTEYYGTMTGPTTWASDDLFTYDCKSSFTSTETGETFDAAGLVKFTRKTAK